MARFVIRGGRRLTGTVTPGGNKNAVLPMLAASVLTEDAVVLENVPRIDDVRIMLDLLADLGVSVEWEDHRVRLCAAGLRRNQLSPELCRRVRSSILLAGPLVARLGRVVLPPPGGDIIGRRRLDTHFEGLQALGITVTGGSDFRFRCKQLRGADIVLDEASVTATENILMAAVLAEGRTSIFNAACEPHVQDLGRMLNQMGARIEGLGTNRLIIEGVKRLQGVTYRVQSDLIEIGSFLAAAAVTGGDLTLTDVAADELAIIARPFRRLGINWTWEGGALHLTGRGSRRIARDFGSTMPKIEDGPWPAFPSDLMSVAIVAATQARGTILFFEKMFESRMYFVDQLIGMGAHIVQCDPHRVIVAGATRLQGMHIASPDIRAGMALVIAALAARGVSRIDNAQSIDRGYEALDVKLRALGADIVREEL